MAANEARPIRARATELHGSNAGAGSGALTVYRKHRRMEMDRLNEMDRERIKEEKAAESKAKHEENAANDRAKLEKNRRKRMRRKAASGSKKADDDGDESKDDDTKDNEEGMDADQAKALLEMAEEELMLASSKQDTS